MRRIKQLSALGILAAVTAGAVISCPVTAFAKSGYSPDQVITLRVCNWEEYIDEGDWEEDEVIIAAASFFLEVT